MNNNTLEQILEEIAAREFDILCVNAPATSQDKVELPGEPVLMQYALSFMLDRVQKTKQAILNGEESGNSFFPRTSEFNKELGQFGKSDELLYDPRIWNASAKKEFQKKVDSNNYSLALFTTLSQSHPYALEMARMIKAKNPETIVVFGGNHQSETISKPRANSPKSSSLSEPIIDKHHTLRQILDQKVDDVVDFTVGGQGEICVNYLMSTVGKILAKKENLTPGRLKTEIEQDAEHISQLAGDFTIAYIQDDKIRTQSASGKKTSILQMPDHTDFFTPKTINRTLRFYDQAWNRESSSASFQTREYPTGHLVSKNKCVMKCYFCSEAADGNDVQENVFAFEDLKKSLEAKIGGVALACLTEGLELQDQAEMFYLRTLNGVANGIGSLFDDTSTHFSGDFDQAEKYAHLLRSAKEKANGMSGDFSERLQNFKYAYQFTVEQLLRIEQQKPQLLKDIVQAGGRYLYVGLESMSEDVLRNVHKYAVIRDERFAKKSETIEHVLRYVKSQSTPKNPLTLGTSVLFGLKGETPQTVETTITRVGDLMREGLIDLASPNIYTFHPQAPLGAYFQRQYGFEPNYTEIVEVKAPFTYFEEANPRNFSPLVSHRDLKTIVDRTNKEWKRVNASTIRSRQNQSSNLEGENNAHS